MKARRCGRRSKLLGVAFGLWSLTLTLPAAADSDATPPELSALIGLHIGLHMLTCATFGVYDVVRAVQWKQPSLGMAIAETVITAPAVMFIGVAAFMKTDREGNPNPRMNIEEKHFAFWTGYGAVNLALLAHGIVGIVYPAAKENDIQSQSALRFKLAPSAFYSEKGMQLGFAAHGVF